MSRPLIYSLAACALAVAVEVLLAGRGIKQLFAQLRVPRFVPPLWLWAVIGLLYYAVCFILLYRVLSLSADRPLRNCALALLAAIMLINALWNYFFFRSRNLVHAYVIGLAYSALAAALFAALLYLDQPAA